MKALAAVFLLCAAASVSAQAPDAYVPPRLAAGVTPGLPSPLVVSGGEVIIQAIVDTNGALTRPVLLRSTPPFSQMLLQAIGTWRFVPARVVPADGEAELVDAPIVIAAEYRPPSLNGPTLGEPPRDLAASWPDTPYPVTTAMPPFPPEAVFGGMVMFEASLDEHGGVTGVRTIRADPGFEIEARAALSQWKFSGASRRGRPAPSVALVVFGFSQPVVTPDEHR